MITNHELGKALVRKYKTRILQFSSSKINYYLQQLKVTCSLVSTKFCCFFRRKDYAQYSVGLFAAFHSWIELIRTKILVIEPPLLWK